MSDESTPSTLAVNPPAPETPATPVAPTPAAPEAENKENTPEWAQGMTAQLTEMNSYLRRMAPPDPAEVSADSNNELEVILPPLPPEGKPTRRGMKSVPARGFRRANKS